MKLSPWPWAVLACLIAACVSAGEGDPLQPWRDPAYTKRFCIEVRPPGMAGAGTLAEPETASVILPLRPAQGAQTLGPLLLVGQDGAEHSVITELAGTDARITFRTHSGLRRFCLYAGATKPDAKQSGVLKMELPGGVKMRGCTAPADFVYSEQSPLTLARFQAVEQKGEGGLGQKSAPNIDDPECPFFKINVGIFGHIGGIVNPERYAAVYEGFLRAPVEGEYRFSVDTPGAAHLLINGQPVIAADTPDTKRPPFALTGAVQLPEGVHRVTLYYAESNPPGQTNVSLGIFGVRLHWQPPFSKDMLCVPPQAFARSLPAVVTRMEGGNNSPQPFINVETLGQALAGAYKGDKSACERVMLVASATGAMPGSSLRAATSGMADVSSPAGAALAAWVPAGAEVKLTLVGPDNAAVLCSRTVNFPVLGKIAPELLDLEGELEIKSAPNFLYPGESGHVHLETLLSPAPVLVFKERHETRLLPPPPRPMGQFRVTWFYEDAAGGAAVGAPGECEATPLEGMRRRQRLSLGADSLEAQAKAGGLRMFVRLSVGGAEVETVPFRFLHAMAAWPGAVQAAPDHLVFTPSGPKAAGGPERVIMLVPKESEAEYRKFRPLKAFGHEQIAKDALFVGDPLVEGAAPKSAGELVGVAKSLAAQLPGVTWQGVYTPGPHRYLPIFRVVAELEAYVKAQPAGALPPLAVLCLGGGDVVRQTPVHTFERAVDVLIKRLRLAGVKRIVAVGVLPEPGRERQCDAYQDRVLELLRQHHVDCVDVLNAWVRDGNWARHYALDGVENAPVYGPVPNAAAREEIAKMIKAMF